MNVVAAAAIESPALERSVRRKAEANSLAIFGLKKGKNKGVAKTGIYRDFENALYKRSAR